MSNKISRAARERQARTGEPYTLARRMVIEEHAAAKATRPPEPALVFADEHGEFLKSLLAPLDAPPEAS